MYQRGYFLYIGFDNNFLSGIPVILSSGKVFMWAIPFLTEP